MLRTLPFALLALALVLVSCAGSDDYQPKAGDILISLVDDPDAGDETPTEKARHHKNHAENKGGSS